MNVLDELADSIGQLGSSNRVIELTKEAIAEGLPATDIVEKGIRKGLDYVGQQFEHNTYFLAELLYGAELTNEALEVLRPQMEGSNTKPRARIVLGTVKGDMHDIGKNIFKSLAMASGFKVKDLGVDVEADTFVENVAREEPEILAMSALLTTTVPEMKVVVDSLRKAGLRDRVKIILGGNAVSREFGRSVEADAVALTAVEGVEICKKWTGKSD